MKGIDYQGGDIGPAGGHAHFTETKEKCQKLCQDTSECFYFTWVTNTFPEVSVHKRCFLKNQSIKKTTLEGVYSGPKTCKGNLHFI